MPIFRIQVNYTFQTTNKWSNVWHATASGMPAIAAAVVTEMEGPLLNLLSTSCILKSFLISEEGTDAFFTVDRNSAGLYSSSGPLLPLWNTVKVVFPPSNFGRPDLKYFKGVVGENVQTDGILNSNILGDADAAVESLIDAMDTNSTPLCSKDGDLYETAQVQPAVQMRQMHRKRRKKAAAPAA